MKYSKERNIIRLFTKKEGVSPQDKKKFSSLKWKNFFKEDAIQGEEIEILLKMLKNEKLNFDQPYFSCLRFHL